MEPRYWGQNRSRAIARRAGSFTNAGNAKGNVRFTEPIFRDRELSLAGGPQRGAVSAKPRLGNKFDIRPCTAERGADGRDNSFKCSHWRYCSGVRMKTHLATQYGSVLSRRDFVQTALATGVLATPVARLRAQSTAKLRAAVIGHTGRGDYGHGLDGIFSNRPNIELVALADPDAVGRAKTAAKIAAPRSYADYRELLEKERPNLVSIAMRQCVDHHAIALACLRAGAHIYCEKPFTTTPAEADEVLAEAEKRGLRIAVAHTWRMSPNSIRLKQALAEGLIGDLIEMRSFGKQDSRAGGEDMMVLGTHIFDLLRMLAGDPLSCAARVLWRGRDITRDDGRLVADNVGPLAGDHIFAQFAFSNGVNATFTSAAKLRETTGNWGIELYGSKGVARFNCDVAPNVFLRRTVAWNAQGKADTWEPLDPELLKSPPPNNIRPVDDWLQAIEQKREPACSGRNGAWAVEMALGVYHTALTGRRVSFPLADRNHPLKVR
ncbi:MAG: Gfo/Idh/MocA family oxidoreductase [Verrucomicrobia bacterium]|nr:Gfo/Idh/MocA family oxidoreductase [Verrucomicrobiota bacterium]